MPPESRQFSTRSISFSRVTSCALSGSRDFPSSYVSSPRVCLRNGITNTGQEASASRNRVGTERPFAFSSSRFRLQIDVLVKKHGQGGLNLNSRAVHPSNMAQNARKGPPKGLGATVCTIRFCKEAFPCNRSYGGRCKHQSYDVHTRRMRQSIRRRTTSVPFVCPPLSLQVASHSLCGL